MTVSLEDRLRALRQPTPAGEALSGFGRENTVWLFENYVVRGLSLTRGASLAGVSKSTLTDGRLRHRLRVRNNTEHQLADDWTTPGVASDPARTPDTRKRRRKGGNRG